MLALPKVMGHRGVAGFAPENTLVSMREAAKTGLHWVEFDVKLTSDKIPILFHDDSLERTTGRKGMVADLPFSTMAELDAGSWFSPLFKGAEVPSFDQMIDLALSLGLSINVELKPSQGHARETAEVSLSLLSRRWPSERERPLISSFDRDCLEVARDGFPQWPRGLIVYRLPDDWAAALGALGCSSFHIHHSLATRELVTAAQSMGMTVACYTVNDKELAKQLFEMGIDCLITDDPIPLLKVADALF